MAGDFENGDERSGLRLTRREALRLTVAAGVSATTLTLAVTDPAVAARAGAFLHGVASGDPKPRRVIIWTRVTKADAPAEIPVTWSVAEDAQMRRVVQSGEDAARIGRDHTVKVDVVGLEPGKTYYYRFEAEGDVSPVGRTRTLPEGAVKRAKFAVCSCSNYELGYFNAYREAARRDDLDAVLHLGDYIYEYGPGLEGYTTPATALGLAPKPRDGLLEPREEIVALEQYRARHALYKTDPDLQKLQRQNPFIHIWDDHEVANDAYVNGAENHQPETEGPWSARRRAGIRAFYEWLPVREPSDGFRLDPETGRPDDLYRVFDFGDLARLVMTDSRQAGREKQLATEKLVAAYTGQPPQGPFPLDVNGKGETRTLLGAEQESWFEKRIAQSTQTWQLIGNQVLMFYQAAPDINGSTVLDATQKAQIIGLLDQIFGAGSGAQIAALGAAGLPFPLAADAWTGYPSARIKMLEALSKAPNPVVLTGDSHNAWTANLVLPSAEGAKPVGAEFGGTSISSPGIEQYLLGLPPELIAAVLVETSARHPNDKLIFTDQGRRGLMLVDVTPKAVTVDHVFVSTVFEKGYATETKRFRVPVGKKAAEEAVSS
ncbi:alkaline phosphatase D family protein [Hansschlegelia zhihuaiae]|uniref:Alkaline phosphatase n=1 Tax=Hansschlegelia zhihuaiae TaxID=405005 RepID=A0A4Q0MP95_9HYPH|nr:alkaline phosphatase D family protein [Hansschlegelia zhihuaiae]RXF75425.1 alkaline phosphatase [Hansschlegelia zhihuaiae]